LAAAGLGQKENLVLYLNKANKSGYFKDPEAVASFKKEPLFKPYRADEDFKKVASKIH